MSASLKWRRVVCCVDKTHLESTDTSASIGSSVDTLLCEYSWPSSHHLVASNKNTNWNIDRIVSRICSFHIAVHKCSYYLSDMILG